MAICICIFLARAIQVNVCVLVHRRTKRRHEAVLNNDSFRIRSATDIYCKQALVIKSSLIKQPEPNNQSPIRVFLCTRHLYNLCILSFYVWFVMF